MNNDARDMNRDPLTGAPGSHPVGVGVGGTGGAVAGAAVGGFFLLMFLSLALMHLLDVFLPIGWAALIVAVLWGVVAAVLAVQGKKDIEKIKGLPQTQETLQEIPETLNPAKETR